MRSNWLRLTIAPIFTGVEIAYDREILRVGAGFEVVLSLGAINTPKVLMLSGIADQAELQRLGIPLVQHLLRRRVMPASLQKFPDDRKIDPNHERPIKCPYCAQRYLLVWDDAEWNSVKDWIRVAEAAVHRSHRLQGDIELVPRLKVLPKS
jgi:choline dehydrogenase-like flavoprotein